MVEASNDIGKRAKDEEVLAVLFGEEFRVLVDDGFDGSKEELKVFREVFFGASDADAEKDECLLAKLFVGLNLNCGGSVVGLNVNCGGSVLTSCSSERDLPPPIAEGKSPSALCLDAEKKGPEHIYSGTSTDLSVQDPVHEPSPCHVVKEICCGTSADGAEKDDCTSAKPSAGLNCGGSVLTSCSSKRDSTPMQASENAEVKSKSYVHEEKQGPGHTYAGTSLDLPCHVAECKGGSLDNRVKYKYKFGIRSVRDVKIADAKSVTSPNSQESVASGIFGTSENVCIKNRIHESVNLHTVGTVLKKPSSRELQFHLESYAHRLLVDAGWKIKNRTRGDRQKLAYHFIRPEGRSLDSLSTAWKACGLALLSSAPDSVIDGNGREWSDVKMFSKDMTDILSYIDQDKSLSLLGRWRLLDPFMAVVWIDRRFGALRKGSTLRAVNSTTFILNQSDMMSAADSVAKGINSTSGEHSLCSLGNLSTVLEGFCNQQQLVAQACCDVESRKRCVPTEGQCTCCTEMHKGSVEEGLLDEECLLVGSEGSLSRRKRAKRSVSKSTVLQKDSGFSEIPPLANMVSPLGRNTDFCGYNHMALPIYQDLGPFLYENPNSAENILGTEATESTQKQTSRIVGPTTKVRKKSKKVSEIEGTGVSVHCVERNIHDKSRQTSALSVGGSTYNRLGLGNHLERANGLIMELSPRCIEQSENFEEQMNDCQHASSIEQVDASTSLKKQKLDHGSNKAPTQINGHEISANGDIIPKVFHGENINIEALADGGTSSDLHSNQKLISGSKSQCKMKTGVKRVPRARINDNELLITSLFQKKSRGARGKSSVSKIQGSRKLKSEKRSCRLLPRALGKGGKHTAEGKRFTLGARTVLCWLVEMGSISLKDKVQFRSPKDEAVVKEGWVTREGILCSCCSKILSVSEFKAHAGFNQQRPPLSLFLQSDKSYTSCQLHAWSVEYKTRKGGMQVMGDEEADENDDTCALCGDGGELVCCDNCPSTYHQSCLSAQELPEGNWYCPHCVCGACGEVTDGKEAPNSMDVFECLQCGHKYHDTCFKRRLPYNGQVESSKWFCGEHCQKVYLGFRSRVGVVNHIDDGFSWTILR